MKNNPQDEEVSILDKVETLLGPILSPRQPIELVELSFSGMRYSDQSFALHWLQVITVSNIELAYVFASEIGTARKSIDLAGVEQWLKASLALYDIEGLYPAIQALRDVKAFKRTYLQQAYLCRLSEVKPHLDTFIRGLAGRGLYLKPADGEVYTDTRYLFLPDQISRFRDKQKNIALYKSMACFLWAQTWYGTFRKKDYKSASTQQRLDHYESPERAKRTFLQLENIRLLAHIKQDLPGLYREMSLLSPLLIPSDKTWAVISSRLSEKGATVEDSFEALDKLMSLGLHDMNATAYLGDMNLEEVESALVERSNNIIESIRQLQQQNQLSQQELQQSLQPLLYADAETPILKDGENSPTREEQKSGGDDSMMNDSDAGSNSGDTIKNEQLRRLIDSLLQDVEYIDEDMISSLLNVDDAGSMAGDGASTAGSKEDTDAENYSEPAVIPIDEWDYLRQSYRPGWCQVRLREVEDGDNDFKQQTEKKYPFLASQIRKIFEAMRDQPRYANRQTDGDEVDLDAVVDMYTAQKAGEELSERLYIRRLNNERNVSVCLLIDMSGSTKGWINLAMRESLILVSEALNTLGDQYSILGFSGLTRQRCEIYQVKDFSDTRLDLAHRRIGNIQAKDYTRMGFAIRYATRRLMQTEARHRILLMLSDGKPDDYDGYQGEYGIQDTRRAILEAQGSGINPYSITIDKQAQTYLPRLFGPGQYMILNDVSRLPLKLSEVYQKLSRA